MASVRIFDCQHDSTNLTNSFVVGRTSGSSDYGKFISAKDFVFEDDIFFELEANDYDLRVAINSLGWTDLYTNNNGISLGV